MDDINRLKKIIDESKHIVFFGGAGVSTESGIPDFRSEAGLYKAKQEFGMSPEEMVSHSFFVHNPDMFYKYYKENMIYKDAEPNNAHKALRELEKKGKLKAIVTQNIDGLHQRAGSENVLELHGSILRNYCLDCGAGYDLDYVTNVENCEGNIPKCNQCQGIVRPDVVLYEEALNNKVIMEAIEQISKADTLIVGGTSLVVYPAAGLLQYFKGENIVLINNSSLNKEIGASLIIRKPIGEVMEQAVLL